MSAEANKKIVLDLFENLSAGKIDLAMAHLSDNATWTVMGDPKTFPLAGTKTKEQLANLLVGVRPVFPKGVQIIPKGLTAEGDRVALEAQSYGEHVNGKVYKNLYHFLFILRDAKVQSVREYLDTIHAKDVLVD